MLLNLDGSAHAWLGEGRRYDLLVALDDATSEIYITEFNRGFAVAAQPGSAFLPLRGLDLERSFALQQELTVLTRSG